MGIMSCWKKDKRGEVLCSLQLIKVKVKVAQSCQTLFDPVDYTVHGILQARIPEWVAFPFSRGSSQPRDRTQVSHIAGILYQLSHKGSPQLIKETCYWPDLLLFDVNFIIWPRLLARSQQSYFFRKCLHNTLWRQIKRKVKLYLLDWGGVSA